VKVGEPISDYIGEKVIGTLFICHLPPVVAGVKFCGIVLEKLEKVPQHFFRAPFTFFTPLIRRMFSETDCIPSVVEAHL